MNTGLWFVHVSFFNKHDKIQAPSSVFLYCTDFLKHLLELPFYTTSILLSKNQTILSNKTYFKWQKQKGKNSSALRYSCRELVSAYILAGKCTMWLSKVQILLVVFNSTHSLPTSAHCRNSC